MSVVGIADASLMENEPAGRRPSDLLPGCKSIVVFGQRMIMGTAAMALRKFEDGVSAASGSYHAYGIEQAPNLLLISASYEFSNWMEKEFNTVAAALPCGGIGLQNCQPLDPTLPRVYGGLKQRLPFNTGKAAELAGLGQMGYHGFFLTPDFGPRIILGALLTTLELDCDAPYAGAKLCDPAVCKVCVEKCPTHAIPEFGSGKGISANRCMLASCGFKAGFGFRSSVKSDDPTDDEIRMAVKMVGKEFPDHLQKSSCDLCAIYCPVGQQNMK